VISYYIQDWSIQTFSSSPLWFVYYCYRKTFIGCWFV